VPVIQALWLNSNWRLRLTFSAMKCSQHLSSDATAPGAGPYLRPHRNVRWNRAEATRAPLPRRRVEAERAKQQRQALVVAGRQVGAAWIATANVRSDRAAKAIRVGVEVEVVKVAAAELSERLAIEGAADHRDSERFAPCRVAAGPLVQPAQETGHVLLELAYHQVAAVAAEVGLSGRVFGARKQSLRLAGRIEQRAVGIAAVSIWIAEQEFAEAAQVVVFAAGLVARQAPAPPVELGLREAIGKAEGFVPAHVASGQAVDHPEASRAFGRDPALPIGQPARHRVEHDQHMRHTLACAPIPSCRVFAFDVAQPACLAGAAAQPGDEFGRESVDDACGHAQGAPARAGQDQSQDRLGQWIDAGCTGDRRLREAGASRLPVDHPQRKEHRVGVVLVAKAQQALDVVQLHNSRRLRRLHSSFSHANACASLMLGCSSPSRMRWSRRPWAH
jgi:hypothetical protein